MSSERDDLAAIAGVVDRPRLYHVLDSPLARVCLLQGPSGCGKTTLLRSWALHDGVRPGLTWVSLSSAMTSREAFWQHVASSAVRLGGLTDDTVADIRSQLNLQADPVQIASDVLAGAGPVVLVLDAYEHLGDAMGRVDEDLARLMASAPNLRLMITTRAPTRLSDLNPPGGSVRVISLGELAMTEAEVGALITAQTGLQDEELAASVTEATRGFALTVRAIVLMLAQLGRIPRLDSVEWNAVVAARLESLLPDASSVRFVTDTSVPPYFDVELARLLSGREDTADLLNMLERNGFGRWIPYARRHNVFQYVETIRDTFRSRAAEDADRYRQLCVVTAGWLLEHEEVVELALQFAIDGGDYTLADRVFVSLVINNPDSYMTDRFLATLRKVPREALSDYPMLAFGLALALAGNTIMRSEAPWAARIAAESPARPVYLEPSLDTFSLVSMQAIALRLALSFRDSGEASREALRSVDTIAPELVSQFGMHVGTIIRQLSYSIFQGGKVNEALTAINRSITLCPTPITKNYSIVYAAGFSAFAGDVVKARSLMGSIDPAAWPLSVRRSFLNGMGAVAHGYACLDDLDSPGALETLREVEAIRPTAEFWALLTGISVAARHGLGMGLAEARRVAAELAESFPPPGVGDNIATERLCAMLALAFLAGGCQEDAERIVADQPIDSPQLAMARIAVLLSSGRDREAFHVTRTLLTFPGHTIRTLAETHTFGAIAALRYGDPEQAWLWLSGAAVAWEAYGPRLHLTLTSARDRRMLGDFAQARGSSGLQRFLAGSRTEALAGGRPLITLTKRESIVLAVLAEHDSIRAIADQLVVSPHTIKSQLQSVYRKLGVSSRQAALAVAREQGLLDGPEKSGA